MLVTVFALALGSVWAADKSADENKTDTSGATLPEERTFAELDKNNDGFISKAEAAADPALAKDFDKFDLNHDRKLSRAEYLAARGKEDTRPEANKTVGKDKAKKKISQDLLQK
jgi:EF hand